MHHKKGMFGSTTGTTGGFAGFGSTASAAKPAGGFGSPAPSGFGTTSVGFGSNAAQTSSGFGSTAQPGGFGSTTTQTSGFGAPTGNGQSSFGGFGSTTTAPAFGSAAPSFGAPAAGQTSSFGGFGSAGGFGASSTTPSKPAGSTTGGFGSTTGGFGQIAGSWAPPSSGFAMQPGVTAAGQAAPSTTGKIARSIEKLQRAYAPYQDMNGKSSAQAAAGRYNDDCMFKTFMYDRRNGSAHASDPSLSGHLLEQAELNNPDPSRYYPVRILGIDALKARFDQQQAESLKLKEHLHNLKEVVDAVELSNTQISTRFSALQMKQVHIYQKLMALLRKVEVLRCHGKPLEESEARYRALLNQILGAMKAPYLQIQELSNTVAQQDMPQDVYADASYDAQEMEALYDALRRQREGLEYVTEILAKDVRDVKIVKSALQEADNKT